MIAEVRRIVIKGDVDSLRAMADSNPDDVDEWCRWVEPKSGDTLLIYAARFGHLSVTVFLVEDLHLAPKYCNAEGKQAVHEAAINGHASVVAYLLSKGVDVDALKHADWTPLMLACAKKHVTVVEVLVQNGANLELRNKDGWNCFQIAIREKDNLDVIRLLIDHQPTIWRSTSKNGRNALHTACLYGSLDAIALLLAVSGCTLDAADHCGHLPLMDALKADRVDVARMLLASMPCDVTQRDSLGRSVVHLCAETGAIHSLQFLLDNKMADVSHRCEGEGKTPLHFAAKEGHLDTVRWLIQHGADPAAQDARGRTALELAERVRRTDVVNLLRESMVTS